MFMSILKGIISRATGGGAELFDDAIDALAPNIWYKFDDASFATTIIDHGTVGADLTSQNTVDASVGAAMKSGGSQSIDMPAHTAGNWATEAAQYKDAADAVSAVFGGADAFTFIFSFNSADLGNGNQVFFKINEEPSGGLYLVQMFIGAGTGAQEITCGVYTGGGSYPTQSTTLALDDSGNHLVIWRNSNSPAVGRTLELDGVTEFDGVQGGNPWDFDVPFFIGNSTTVAKPGFTSDCFAGWDRWLSDAEIHGMFERYDTGVYTPLAVINDPTDITGCILWLDASDRGSTTNQWDDKSGEGNHFTSASAGEFPTFSAGEAIFDYAGPDHLDGPDFISALTEGECFIRLTPNNDPGIAGRYGRDYFTTYGGANQLYPYNNGLIYETWGRNSYYIFASPFPLDEEHTLNISSKSTEWKHRQNGVPIYRNTTTVGFTTTPIIGADYNGTNPYDGKMKAYVMFDHVLTTNERMQMEAYMATL